MKNPAWQEAEEARVKAEAAYSAYMKSHHALDLREKDHAAFVHHVEQLNAAIEAANRRVRTTPETL